MIKKEQKNQIILILIGLILIILTYFYYPYMKKTNLENDNMLQSESKKIDVEEDTSFENVEYKGLYDLDKSFTVRSEKANIFNDEPDIVYMTKMHVILYLNDGRIVNILSNKGRYNKVTYDCFFENDVKATDGETKIFSRNLDLLATENSVKIYNNVVLKYPAGSLQADKIDYDFETKYFKVSMFDDESVKMKVIK
tara:strand:+ start:399 stop:986 length:588 start_codon:yes stop_codon:yes gene_type:complete